jgi:hypothetical protein
MWVLPALKATPSPSSTDFLDFKALCYGMPGLLAPSTGLLEPLAPCCGMPELLALKK